MHCSLIFEHYNNTEETYCSIISKRQSKTYQTNINNKIIIGKEGMSDIPKYFIYNSIVLGVLGLVIIISFLKTCQPIGFQLL